MASEVGVIDVDPSEVIQKGRLKPGRMLLADVFKKEITNDIDIKNELCRLRPVEDWLTKTTTIQDLHEIFKSQNPSELISYLFYSINHIVYMFIYF